LFRKNKYLKFGKNRQKHYKKFMEKNAKILMFLYIFNENKYIYLINKNQSSIILCNTIYYNLNKYILILQTIMGGK